MKQLSEVLLGQVGSRPLTVPCNRVHPGILGGLLLPTLADFLVFFRNDAACAISLGVWSRA